MGRRKGRNRRGGEPTPQGDEPVLRPTRVQGRAAWCPCGEGILEMPGPSREDREKMRAGSRVYYVVVCYVCVRRVTIEDNWNPRDKD